MTRPEPPPQELINTFAVSYSVACAFFCDSQGRVLLVKANDRDHWQFVGGMVDRGEAPHMACVRETKEEIGLDLPAGDLLVLDWLPQVPGIVAEPLAFYLFDGGVIDDPGLIRLQADELEDFDFFPSDQAASLFPEGHQGRVQLALEARQTGKTVYQPFRQLG